MPSTSASMSTAVAPRSLRHGPLLTGCAGIARTRNRFWQERPRLDENRRLLQREIQLPSAFWERRPRIT
eukprot:3779944-Pyramimonas_sp.AAC.1